MPPELSVYGLLLLRKVQRGLGGKRAEMLKSCFPKIPSTRSISKEKSSHCLQIFPRQPLLCPSREGERRGGEKNALGERWGSDKGRHKKGVDIAFKFRGPTGLQRAIPSGAGTRAPFQSGSEPKLPQPRDGGPSESPASSAPLGAPAGVQVSPPVPACLTLCPDSSH